VTSSGDKYPVPHRDFIFPAPRVLIVLKLNYNTVGVDPLPVVGPEDLQPLQAAQSEEAAKALEQCVSTRRASLRARTLRGD
jgi:hypothetical protein